MKKKFCTLLTFVFCILALASCKPIVQDLTPYEAWETYVMDESDQTVGGWYCNFGRSTWEATSTPFSDEQDGVDGMLELLRMLPVSEDRRVELELTSEETVRDHLGLNDFTWRNWLTLGKKADPDPNNHIYDTVLQIDVKDDLLILTCGDRTDCYRLDVDLDAWEQTVIRYAKEKNIM